MNIIIRTTPAVAHQLLTGSKRALIRSRVPRRLEPGDTVFIYPTGQIHGHLTYIDHDHSPLPKKYRRTWLEYAATAATITEPAAMRALATGIAHTIELRNPTPYPHPVSFEISPTQSFIYTHYSPITIH